MNTLQENTLREMRDARAKFVKIQEQMQSLAEEFLKIERQYEKILQERKPPVHRRAYSAGDKPFSTVPFWYGA